jgi:two-component system, sensor histidine kinase PdtaS
MFQKSFLFRLLLPVFCIPLDIFLFGVRLTLTPFLIIKDLSPLSDSRSGHKKEFCLVVCAFCLVSLPALANDAVQQRLDSLEAALTEMAPSEDKFHTITGLAFDYARLQPERAMEFAEAAKTLADELQNEELQLRTNYYFGVIHKNLGNHERALSHFEPYADYFTAKDDKTEICYVRYQTGITKAMMGNYLEAIKDLYVNIKMAQELGYKDTEANTMTAIASIYREMEDYDKAIAINEEAHALFQELDHVKGMAQALINNGNIFSLLGQTDRALKAYEQSLELLEGTNDIYYRAYTYLNMGELHIGMEAWDKAERELNKSLPMLLELGQSRGISDCRHHLGQLYLKTGRPAAAIPEFEYAREIARQGNMLKNERNAVEGLAKSYEQSGDYRASTEYYKTLTALSDSMLNAEITNQISELNVQYETERKEKTIALLEKDRMIARRNQIVLGLSGLVLLLVALGIGLLYRNRKQHIHRLREKNQVISKMLDEKDFLLREIHHRVKNNLQIISSLLQLQSRYIKEPTALQALNEGESRVRSMSIIHQHLYSYDRASEVQVKNYVADLCAYIQQSFNIDGDQIKVHEEVESMYLDVSVMIPLGLILNELLTNAFKYAFPGEKEGNIWVRIHKNEGCLVVRVKDDGIGMEADQVQQGFGSRLIRAFLNKLEAEAQTTGLDGTEVTIRIDRYQPETIHAKSA